MLACMSRQLSPAFPQNVEMGSQATNNTIKSAVSPQTHHSNPSQLAGRCDRPRPKLSLDTISATSPKCDSGTTFHPTSLRLETLSVVSPTSHNTLYNGHFTWTSDDSSPTSHEKSESRIPNVAGLATPRAPLLRTRSTPVYSGLGLSLQTALDPADSTTTSRMSVPPTTMHDQSLPRTCGHSKRVSFCPKRPETIRTSTYIVPHSDLLDSPSAGETAAGPPSPASLPSGSKPAPPAHVAKRETRNDRKWRVAIAALADESTASAEQTAGDENVDTPGS